MLALNYLAIYPKVVTLDQNDGSHHNNRRKTKQHNLVLYIGLLKWTLDY